MAQQTDRVAADTDDLRFFVEHGERYLDSLRRLEAEVDEARSRVAAAVGEGPITEGLHATLSFGAAVAAAERGNRFVATVHDALTGTGETVWLAGVATSTGPGVASVRSRAAVHLDRSLWEAGLLELDDGAVSQARRDDLVAMLLAGIPTGSPIGDLILARRLAPPSDELRDAVAAAIGDGLTPAEVGIDPRYFPPAYRSAVDRSRSPGPGDPGTSQRRPFGPGLDDPDRGRSRLLAIALTGSHLGRQWQGRALADWYLADRPVDPLGVTPGDAASGVGLPLAHQLNQSPNAAAAFFNRLGARATAELPSLNPADGRFGTVERDVVLLLSNALAAASRSGDLSFGGGDLIDQHDDGYGAPHVSLLFTGGEFDHRFLVDATATQLERHRHGDRLLGTDFGASATNILLDRAAESPTVSTAIIGDLGPGRAATYLAPDRPFSRSESGTYPVTMFLAAAGRDTAGASIILTAAAADDISFSDPGVAGGVDAVMGQHATVMYSGQHLEHRGISVEQRLTRADWSELGFDGEQWKLIRSRVLEHGMGGGLVAGNNTLIFEAIGHDLADGDLSSDPKGYGLMALTSGALDEQWFQRVLEISEQHDADAATRNGYAAAGLSVGLAIGAAYALPLSAAGAAAGVAIGSGGSLALAQWPIDYWDTDLANTELRQRIADQRRAGRVWQDAVIGPAVMAAASTGRPVRTTSGRVLSIEHEGAKAVLIATNPATGDREIDPTITWHPDGRVGDPRNDTTSQIHEHYLDGQDLADPAVATSEAGAMDFASPVDEWIELPGTDGDDR